LFYPGFWDGKGNSPQGKFQKANLKISKKDGTVDNIGIWGFYLGI
jgi:hypothetical protein